MKKVLAILLAILVQASCLSALFSMGASATAALQNLIPNANFANETAGTIDGFGIYTEKNGAATVSGAIDNTVTSPVGSKSIRFDMAGINGTSNYAMGTVYTKNTYKLKKNCYYEFSVWVKTQNSIGSTLTVYEPNFIKYDHTQATSAIPSEGQNIYSFTYASATTRVIRKHINYTYTANGTPTDGAGTGNASIAIMRNSSGMVDASTTYDPQNTNNGWVEYKMTFKTTDNVDPVYNVPDDVPVCFGISTRKQVKAASPDPNEAKMWVSDFKLTEQYATLGWAEAEGGAGTVTATPEICSEGDSVTYSTAPIPDSGNVFSGWYQGSTLVSTEPTFTTTFSATDKYIAKYSMSNPVVVEAENNAGVVSASPAGGSEGTPITLTARPYDGNTFTGWYHKGVKISDNAEFTTPFDSSDKYIAKFTVGNLITDPSYEAYANNTELMGTTWKHNSGSSATWISAKVTNKQAYSGSQSLQLFARHQKVYSRIEGLKPNTVYTLSFYWYMDAYNATNKNTLSSYGVMPEGTTIGSSTGALGFSVGPNSTGNWQKAQVYFATGANDTAGNIVLNYGSETSTDAALASLYLDELAIFEGGPQPGAPIDLIDPDSDDAVKVLAIGNSFSANATAHLRAMALADNVDLRVGNMSIGGASLQLHASNAQINSPTYDFAYYSKYRQAYYSKTSLEQALKATDWDYVTIQQASPLSGKYDTSYQPYANNLMAYIRENCPGAKIVVHQTWAYETGYANLPVYYPATSEKTSQQVMWDGIFYSYNRLAQDAGDAQILPSGAAWQETRGAKDLNGELIVGDKLAIDGFHGNERGIMLANYVWYEYFTGITPTQCKYDPTILSNATYPITTVIANTLKEKAHFALEGYKKANEIILGIKALGIITTESGPAITALEAKFDALEAHELLSTNNVDYSGAVTNYADLVTAREAYDNLTTTNPDQEAADVVIAKINAIGTVTLNSKAAIEDAEAAYAALTTAQKALVTNYSVLIAARATFDALEPGVTAKAGDINGDDTVDLKDVTTLSRYIAGWQGLTYVESTLDTNGDSVVDLKDVTLLSRFVAGWDVTLSGGGPVSDKASITLSDGVAIAGKSTSVKVILKDIAKLGGNIAGYQFTITYDSTKLDFTGYTPSTAWSSDSNITAAGTAVIVADDNNTSTLTITSNGQLGILNFTAKSGVSGDAIVSITVNEVTNSDATPYASNAILGSSCVISIAEGPIFF